MKLHRLALLAALLLTCSSVPAPSAPPPSNRPLPPSIIAENSTALRRIVIAGPSPIVITQELKNLDGDMALVVKPDGEWLFTGRVDRMEKNKDIDVTVGLRGNDGHIILFHFVGDDSNGIQWCKHGQSTYLKDQFNLYASDTHMSYEIRFHEDKNDLAKEYRQREERKSEFSKAKNDAEMEKMLKEELAAAQAEVKAMQAHHVGGGGNAGTSIGGVLQAFATAPFDTVKAANNVAGDVAKGVAKGLSDVGKALASIF